MTTLDLSLLLAIDQRIALGQDRITALGVVAARSFDSNIMVTIDGSALAVPCKVFGDVEAYEGDRVGLVKFGLWWVVVGTLTKRWRPQSGDSLPQSTGTTTSASFSDTPTLVHCAFTKIWDATRVFVQIGAGAYCTAIPCETEWAATFTGPTGGTYATTNTPHTAAAAREMSTDWRFVSGLAAGVYDVKVQWRRKSGTGTSSTDSFEKVALNVMEVSPT